MIYYNMSARRHVGPGVLLASAAALGIVAGVSHRAAAEPRVVATIPPIHSLVAGVMAGVGEPTLLIPGGASPHAYAMRPSEARALADADIVFWVGEAMETFLERPLAALTRDTTVVELAAVSGITLLPARAGGAFAVRDGAADDDHADTVVQAAGHGYGHAFNPHIWLGLENAEVMVTRIAAALSAHDPANAAAYRANGTALRDRLHDLEAELGALLEPVHDVPYAVFHDAYPYLEEAFALRPVGAITVSPDQQPGARRLAELRKRIVDVGARCVFSEPQFQSALVATVVSGTGAVAGELDPLGATIAPGPDHYFTLMRRLAVALHDCLAGTG